MKTRKPKELSETQIMVLRNLNEGWALCRDQWTGTVGINDVMKGVQTINHHTFSSLLRRRLITQSRVDGRITFYKLTDAGRKECDAQTQA